MLSDSNKQAILLLWSNYSTSGFTVQDMKGNFSSASDFDHKRLKAIADIKILIDAYLSGETPLKAFKSSLDGYNKRNNLWGFAAMKGQMFFNQLCNSSGQDLTALDSAIKKSINLPKNLHDAGERISFFVNFVEGLARSVDDKRRAPKTSSVAYFLSYFWQINEPDRFPIIYTSMISTLVSLKLWETKENYSKEYLYFAQILEEIRLFLQAELKRPISQWDLEHCFWKSLTNKGVISPAKGSLKQGEKLQTLIEAPIPEGQFDYRDFIPPIVADLIEAGALKGDTRAIKGSVFEKKVALLFKMLDFDVRPLGQGKGREPDGIITNRQENIAFIYDAKVRENGYSIGVDDRAIKEYVSKHFNDLEKQGYKKIGFLIISTVFNGSAESIIDEITLETPIKRLSLVRSETLLSLLAFKLSEGISSSEIAIFLLQNGELTSQDVLEHFSDV